MLHVDEQPNKAPARGTHRAHEVLERHTPVIDAREEVGTQVGDKADGLAKEYEGHIGTETDKGVVLLCLVDSGFCQ